MSRFRCVVAACTLAALGAVPGLAGAAPSSAPAKGAAGLPDGVPAAALQPEPVLPVPAGWTGSEAFARTSGTGRLDRGSFLWTDFLYDDRGTTAVPGGSPAEAGVPSFGTYTYSTPAAKANGADIFRAGVHLGKDATTWRVDWNTLADATVPLAVWTMDTDDRTTTGGSAWPAAAGVKSPGIERALVVSSRGAALVDSTSGAQLASLPVTVDNAARSFVVTVPKRLLPVSGTWAVRLASGVADAAGTAMARPGSALPGQPAVYQASFRALAQESPINQFWNDGAQVAALRTGDLSPFAAKVSWSDLSDRRTTPEAAPRGWSPRWYASSVEPGQGKLTGADTLRDNQPNYLGRVQPYSVYIPQSYDGRRPSSLTFLLHSFTQNHNQYASTTPTFSRVACEDRDSICVTTLGRGPDGQYEGLAELDFWEVWARTAASYRLDPERTVVAGYSMGGFGTTKLATEHPDLFAKAVTLAGTPGAIPGLANLREVPFYLAGGVADELVPVTRQKEVADALDGYGFRYRWLVHATDHVAYELQDGFGDAATWMGDPRRSRNPARVTYGWAKANEQRSNGLALTGAYWLDEIAARTPTAKVDAVSSARPATAVTTTTTSGVLAPGDTSGPAVTRQLTWATGAPRPQAQALALTLTGVSRIVIDLKGAGLDGEPFSLTTTSDGPTTVVLRGPDGDRTVTVEAGSATRTV